MTEGGFSSPLGSGGLSSLLGDGRLFYVFSSPLGSGGYLWEMEAGEIFLNVEGGGFLDERRGVFGCRRWEGSWMRKEGRFWM